MAIITDKLNLGRVVGPPGAPSYLINHPEKLSPGAQVTDMGADDFVPAITKDVEYSHGITKAGDLCLITQQIDGSEFTGVFFIT